MTHDELEELLTDFRMASQCIAICMHMHAKEPRPPEGEDAWKKTEAIHRQDFEECKEKIHALFRAEYERGKSS